MKLKKLDINGFKSFVDKTSINFPIGISAIVGPNGCGKSNVMDALKWVMGEQSVRQLRGKSMEDIIFSGTNGRPPLNMAEVSLTLLNDNGSAPEELKDFSEIMITRRVYRSGETAYFINKQPCRLKDIHNIFMGSGMGARSYSVIQQGNVGAITDAGPDERRYFIEEAAGITRYKNRKIEALRKVNSTKQNLLRVLDITSEISRQMGSLKRQAKKAEVYKTFQEKIRFLDVTLGLHQHEELIEKIKETDHLLSQLQDEDQLHSTQLNKIDAAIETIKLKRQEKVQKISDQKSTIFETQRTMDRIENDLSHLKKETVELEEEIKGFKSIHTDLVKKNDDIVAEMAAVKEENRRILSEIDQTKSHIDGEREASAQIKTKLESLNHTLESKKAEMMRMVAEEARYRNIFQNATQNKESLTRRLKRIDEEEFKATKEVARHEKNESEARDELDSLRAEHELLKEKITALRKQLEEKSRVMSEKIKFIQSLEMEKNQADSRFTALKKMQDSYQWYKDGVKAIMQNKNSGDSAQPGTGQLGDVLGLMADILEPDHSYETAVEAVLGESLQYILVKDQHAGLDAIEFLHENKAGRSGFVPVSAIKPTDCSEWAKPEPSLLLLNHVTVKPEFENIAQTIMGHVVVCDDLSQAMSLYNKNGVHQTIVTKEGNVISSNGLMIGGSKDNLSGILEKKHEIKELEQKVETLKKKIAEAQVAFDDIEKELRNLENNLQKLIEQQHITSKDEVEAEKTLYRVSEDLKHAKRHLEVMRLEQERLMGEEQDADEEMAKYNEALAGIEIQVKEAQASVTATSQSIETVADEMESYNQNIIELKMELTARNGALENSSNTLRRLNEFYEDGQARIHQLTLDIEQKNRKKTDSERKIREYEPRLAAMYENLKRLEQALAVNETDYQCIDEELRNNDSIINELKSKRDTTLEKIRMLEVEKSQLEIKRDNTINRLTERYHLPLYEIRRRLEITENIPASYSEMTPNEMQMELSKCHKHIERITDVNLSAIKEYEELKVRFDFLEEQKADLEQAIENLHKVIRKINRITQERFLKTFNAINEKLGIVFPKLFNGGSAKLEMTDPSTPLESGVEFMIHPPGKKLTRLSLLSGGEKALSAIAFIFSIFLIKPTAFCLMDEIDAPLDDANVYRFNDLLKIIGEKSQIIMITHNKHSMEFADSLFGITMEKKGISKVVSVNFEEKPAYVQ